MNIFHLKINAVNLNLFQAFWFPYMHHALDENGFGWKHASKADHSLTRLVKLGTYTWGLIRLCPFKFSHKHISSNIQFWQISFNVTPTEIQYFISSICREITASKILSSAFCTADIQVASYIVQCRGFKKCHEVRPPIWLLPIQDLTFKSYKDVLLHLCKICAWHGASAAIMLINPTPAPSSRTLQPWNLAPLWRM